MCLRSPDATSSVRRNGGKGKLANCNRGTEIGGESRCSDPATASANGEEVEIVALASSGGPNPSSGGRIAGGEAAAVGEAEDERRAGNGGVVSGLGMEGSGKGKRKRKGSSEGLEGFGRERESWDA